jgi:hypothetical protein
MQMMTMHLRQIPRARAMRERSTTAALVAFYGALALIAAITLGTPLTHPF